LRELNLKIAFILLSYWTIWILICTVGTTDGSNAFASGGYSVDGSINSSGFSADEIDTGFSFMSFIAVLGSIGRFVLLALFGITTALTGLPQVLFTAWSSMWTLFTIGFILDSIWSG